MKAVKKAKRKKLPLPKSKKVPFKAPAPAIAPVTLEKCMINGTQQIQVKLTATEFRVLSRLIETKFYESRSSAIRAGLGMLFQGHMTPEEDLQIEKERRHHQPRRSYRR
jgi:Arc/MetJ-type ribon-helix-helix transcriptional regulator